MNATSPRAHHEAHGRERPEAAGHGMYRKLLVMGLLSFVAMYALMYATVYRWEHVHLSLSRAYMAGLMTAPMVVFELALMRAMYPDKRLNAGLAGASAVALAALWLAIRAQAGMGDVQFLKAMIPHHSGAILMCERASIADAEIVDLCRDIVRSQRREIEQMDRILARLER